MVPFFILHLIMKHFLILIVLIFSLFGCEDKRRLGNQMRFSELKAENSGVTFSNNIIENDTLNYFDFPYLYLGGGVSVGDINNDGLTDLYFTGNLVQNKLYLNKGNLQFEDISESAGVTGDSSWYTGVTMADVNNDGYLDIYLNVSQKYGSGANQLLINNRDNTFSEQAEVYGIADESTSIQSTFFDYNNDGYLDLFVANYPLVKVSQGNIYYYKLMLENKLENSGHLYKNNGPSEESGQVTFSDVTTSAGVQNFGLTLGLVASDFNNDGLKDIYLSNDFNVPDYLYKNNGDGTFSEISKDATRHTSMFGMGIDAADFNNDGLTDFLQVDMTAEGHKRSKTNMASMSPETFYQAVDLGFNYQYMQNSLQLNNGVNNEGTPIFSDISRFNGMATTDWSWGSLFADFDNDGNKDVFITNGVKRDVNNNDINEQYNANPFLKQNNSLDFKLLPSTPIANYAFQNNGDYKFSNTTEDWGLDKKGFSNGFVYVDLDNDGDLDLVLNNLDEPASIYVNEAQKTKNNYLKIKLKGNEKNPFGIGAKVAVKYNNTEQFQELTLTRGYQSSVEPILHFGLGNSTNVDEVKVIWADNKEQIIIDEKANQLLEISYENTSQNNIKEDKSIKTTDIAELWGIDFEHKEDGYDDYVYEPLLPHKNSQLGPALAVGDINNDGLEDFYIGNAAGSPGVMYIQQLNGSFSKKEGPWEKDFQFEETGALLFDADNDSDLDLYVVHGGNDGSKPKAYYQDVLYINNKGNFEKSNSVLPEVNASGQEVSVGDYDSDGDLDLFVGGRIVPGKYPFPAKSYILRNDGGKNMSLKYTDVTSEIAPELENAGLVTSALWDDFSGDGNLDLIITGEWMPVRFFKNENGRFKEVTNDFGFEKQTGWWYSLAKADLDADGDLDYLAGNLGLNYKYKAKESAPFEVFADDFDENGSLDIVLGYKKGKTKLPLRGRECSSQQVPAIKRRFKTFESFANADLEAIYGKHMLEKALHYEASTFAHHWIENKGDKGFEMHKLPNAAQFSSINKFQILNTKRGSFKNVLLLGNLYQSEVETPRNDAGVGVLLSGDFKKNIEITPSVQSNLLITGEVKNTAIIHLGKDRIPAYLIAKNNDKPSLIAIPKTEN